MKSNSVGFDNIPISFIKLLLPILLPYIRHLFNFCLTSSQYPAPWKCAKIIPIHKKSRTTDLNDFRPIAILPSLSKCFEKIIKFHYQKSYNGLIYTDITYTFIHIQTLIYTYICNIYIYIYIYITKEY